MKPCLPFSRVLYQSFTVFFWAPFGHHTPNRGSVMPNEEEAMHWRKTNDLLECTRAPLSAHCTGAFLFQGRRENPFSRGCLQGHELDATLFQNYAHIPFSGMHLVQNCVSFFNLSYLLALLKAFMLSCTNSLASSLASFTQATAPSKCFFKPARVFFILSQGASWWPAPYLPRT